MIHRVECADNAAHRLGKASVKVCIGIIGKETVCKKSLDRYIAVLRIAAAEGVRISGRHLTALVKMRGLNCKSVAGLELVLPILAHFLDDSAEFVTYNGGVFLNIVGNPLVFASFNGSLVCAHTD